MIPASTPVPASRLGSSISWLLRSKETGQIRPGSDEQRVIKMMDGAGGAIVSIIFDHPVTFAELQELERRYPVKFDLPEKERTLLQRVNSGVVPWDRLREFAQTPSLVTVETELWPPRVPER